MATPTKKMYDRKGKLIFDPSNPEDVRNYKEKQPLMEALKLVQGLTDPRTGGGLTGATRIISKTALSRLLKPIPKLNKSKSFTTAKAKNALDEIPKDKPTVKTKPTKSDEVIPKINRKESYSPVKRTSKSSNVVPKTTPTITPNIPTNIPISGTTVPDKIKSLSNAEIKAFEIVKNIRELAEKQIKNAPTTTSNTPVAKELWKKPLPTQSFNDEGFRIGGTEAKSILSKLKDNDAARTATKKAFEKSNAEIIKKGIETSNKKITDKVIGAGVVTGVLGAGAGTTYYGMQLSNKDNKQTTGPVDLKRINKSKLRPSKVEGVYITSALVDGKMKDFGIKWNNSTSKWEYYKGGGKPVVKITPKQETVKDNTGGGGSAPIDNNNQNKKTGTRGGGNQTTTTGGGGGTKTPVKPTVTTTPLMGDEEYKKDPRLAILRQQDDDRQLLARAEAQKKEMMEFKPTEVLPTKPLSSLVFKTSPTVTANNLKRDELDEQSALYSIKGDNLIRNKLPLKKKSYGGNLAMLKYMK